MLKLLRKKKVAKRIFYILAAIIIPAFVVWGSASVLNKDKAPDFAGTIFGKKVSFEDFRLAVRAWKTQMKLQYGDKADQVISFFSPTQAAWDRLILLSEAKKRKIKISDAEIIDTLGQYPFLQRDGRFDPQSYNLFLTYSVGLQPRAFEEELRQNLAMAKVFQQVTEGITTTDEEVKSEYEKQNVQTRVKYVFFPKQGNQDKVQVTDEEIKTAYETSKDKFKVPPQINAGYVGIDFKAEATEEDKTAVKEQLKTVLAAAKTKGLAEAAKTANLELKETGLFGFEDPIPGLGWMQDLSRALFDLPQGGFSSIIETGRGAYVFQVKQKNDAYLPELKDAKDKVKDSILAEKSKEFASQKAKEFLYEIKTKALTFEKAAEAAGATVKETPLFSRDGYIPELGMAEPLKAAAFGLAKDAVAQEPIELEQGFYCIQSLEAAAFDEEKFKKEKDEFSKQVLDQKKNKAFNDFFESLKKQANLVNYIPEPTVK